MYVKMWMFCRERMPDAVIGVVSCAFKRDLKSFRWAQRNWGQLRSRWLRFTFWGSEGWSGQWGEEENPRRCICGGRRLWPNPRSLLIFIIVERLKFLKTEYHGVGDKRGYWALVFIFPHLHVVSDKGRDGSHIHNFTNNLVQLKLNLCWRPLRIGIWIKKGC